MSEGEITDLRGLLSLLSTQNSFSDLVDSLGQQDPNFTLSLGLLRATRPYLVAALAAEKPRSILVVTARTERAYNFAEQLVAWQPDLSVLSFAEPAPDFYERAPWGEETIRSRISVLNALLHRSDKSLIVVTSARSLMARTIPRDRQIVHTINLQKGKPLPSGGAESLLRDCLGNGYEPAQVVTIPGTFNRRGGIIDIYPASATGPVRIELWGDQIDSIRSYNPTTQRSLESLSEVTLPPAREALPRFGPVAMPRLDRWFRDASAWEDTATIERLVEEQVALETGVPFPNLEFYLPWLADEPASLIDYLSDDALIVIDDREDLAETIDSLETEALHQRERLLTSSAIPAEMPLPLITWDHLADDLASHPTLELGGRVAEIDPVADLFTPGPRFGGQLKLMVEQAAEVTRGGRNRVIVVSRQAHRLAEVWALHRGQIHSQVTSQVLDVPPPGPPLFVDGVLAEGWIIHSQDGDTHLYTDAEIFGWQRPEPRRRPVKRAVSPESFFADLTVGDFVVHAEYGIGIFDGLKKRTLKGNEREFLLIRYQGGDALYVPIHQADRLSRYVGPDDDPPSLSKLGSADWNRVKAKARENAEEVARDLLMLYSERELIQGHAFGPDSPWQFELEASFPYVETPDQLHALSDVKADMESPRPMDRLICGDVGYGKTEVALRAAFKAVMGGRQVAMLIPTTVLAQQHFETFRSRLIPFPVQVEMLSRFRTRKEQEVVVAGLELGTVDIVIGTHRLLTEDVTFKNLGLVIIDEEQRFGVTHKEQLKRFRTHVDVLTLTATPIPRTLYMGLTGVRDISMIVTPPEERLPVITHVGRRDEDLIRSAIMREIERGGQVFYVHNRVQSIYHEQSILKNLVPEASFEVAHGQMGERELEKIMANFTAGNFDVLVSTSIIEAGLDIPNANTLIVDRADRFGLSQMYQLRGRVGRGAVRAYAYFLHPSYTTLTDEARSRLETIEEETALGAGFSIAMRDLEIRGAGDILGIRQSGQIATVGFHLYTQMLAQAVKRRQEARDDGTVADQTISDAKESVTIDLPFPTYIPTDYVSDLSLRIQLYRRMADLPDEEAIESFKLELIDRFGPPPTPVQNLLLQLRVKALALRARVEAVVGEGDQLCVKLPGLALVDRRALQDRLGHRTRVSRAAIWLPWNQPEWEAALLNVLQILVEERIRLPVVSR